VPDGAELADREGAVSSAAPAAEAPASSPRPQRSWPSFLALAHNALPCVVGIPVFVGVAVTMWRLASIRYPHLGWAQTVANDAKAISFGDWVYGDPAEQYTGMLYTPGYPVLLAPLFRTMWWDGWPIAVTVASGLATSAAIAVVAATGLRPGATRLERAISIVGGIGVGGVAWWIVSTNYRNLLYEGRADGLAWCLALLGLCVLARNVAGDVVRVWPAVTLLSAALWTKQTTVGALLSACILVTWWFVRGTIDRRAWLRFAGALAVTNLVILGVIVAISDGWAVYFLLTMPGRHFRDPAVFVYVKELRNLLVLPALLALVAAAGLVRTERTTVRRRTAGWLRSVLSDIRGVGGRLLRRPAEDAPRRNVPTFAAALLALLVLFLVFSFPPAFTGRRKQGGEANQYIGMLWGLGFLLALAHRQARSTTRAMVTGVVAYGLLLTVIHVGPVRTFAENRSVALPTTYPTARFVSLPYSLRDYARTHEVYLPYDADLSSQFTHRTWPMQQNIVDLLAAGEQPLHLVDAFIDREFDAVAPFDPAADPYASAYGKTEENYLAKLNFVIEQGYIADPALGLWVRRSEPVDLQWLRSCFGPFDIGGAEWEIGRGGGLWCNDRPDSVQVRATPAPITELRTTSEVTLRGSITVRMPEGSGSFEVVTMNGGRQWSVRLEPRPDGSYVVYRIDGDGHELRTEVTHRRGAPIVVELGDADGAGDVVIVPGASEGQVLLRTTAGSAARFDVELREG
jgi:hypothetical protein